MQKDVVKLLDFIDEVYDVNWWISHIEIDELTHFIKWEIKEVEDELREKNSVYLENELWDIAYCYFNAILRLHKEGYIDKNKVFQRAEKKFRERLWAWWKEEERNLWYNSEIWKNVKARQNRELADEHEKLYGKN